MKSVPMKKQIVFVLVALIAFSSCSQHKKKEYNKTEVSTYYLIRHAAKDRTDKSDRNPNLTEEGLQRANNWAKHFKDVRFDMVYSTDYNRTKQTALPTAKANQLQVQLYNPSTVNIKEFMATTKGKTVLIVGHSNTTPKFVNDLLGEVKYQDIADNNNANLYKVTITNDGKTEELSVVD